MAIQSSLLTELLCKNTINALIIFFNNSWCSKLLFILEGIACKACHSRLAVMQMIQNQRKRNDVTKSSTLHRNEGSLNYLNSKHNILKGQIKIHVSHNQNNNKSFQMIWYFSILEWLECTWFWSWLKIGEKTFWKAYYI